MALLARAAAGSMRDALSLLDQAIAHGGGKVVPASVSDMLGTIDQSHLLRLVEAVAGGDAAAAVKVADEMQARSLSFDTALADLASLLLRVALAQSLPDAVDDARIGAACRAARRRIGAALLPDRAAGQARPAARARRARRIRDDGAAPACVQAGRSRAATLPSAASGETEARTPRQKQQDSSWPELVQQLPVTGAARELARNAELGRREGPLFELVVPKGKAYLAERSYVDKLKAALEQHLGSVVSVKVAVGEVAGASAAALEAGEREARRAAAAQAVQGDGFVQDLVNMFDGKVVDSTIREDRK